MCYEIYGEIRLNLCFITMLITFLAACPVSFRNIKIPINSCMCCIDLPPLPPTPPPKGTNESKKKQSLYVTNKAGKCSHQSYIYCCSYLIVIATIDVDQLFSSSNL